MEKTLSLSRQLSSDFLSFISKAVTPFHVVSSSIEKLKKNGFTELSESNVWNLEKGGAYFFTRNNSTIFAFRVGEKFDSENTGFKVIGAHTDSPCLRLSPISKASSQDFHQICVNTYGGGLWHTWFDRELSIAGKVVYTDKDKNTLLDKLFHIDRPLFKIPNLAIHLTPAENRGKFEFNKESHLRPIFSSAIYEKLFKTEEKEKDEASFSKKHPPGLVSLLSSSLSIPSTSILDIDAYLFDANPPTFFGLNEEFISSARIDNLFSSFAALNSILEQKDQSNSTFVNVVVLFDHEECGSQSFQGAESMFFFESLRRIYFNLKGGEEGWARAVAKSFLISADMAHSIHPNYAEKHQQNHQVKLNGGIVLKTNFDQRYATDSVSASIIKLIADRNEVPIQEFVVKNDSPCGSTIGPIISAKTGIKTVDLGAPQLSMHSIRETAGVLDVLYYDRLFKGFFKDFEGINKEILGSH